MSLLEDTEKLLSNMTKAQIENGKLYVPDENIKIGAYVYPGWHACDERDSKFEPGWTEWDIVLNAPPRFSDHNQPRLPLDGPYDDSMPSTAQKQVRLAGKYGIDFFVYGFFWSRGKRVFDMALDD